MRPLKSSAIWFAYISVAISIVLAVEPGVVSPSAQDMGIDEGRLLFVASCASCHGTGGTGGGPVAASMRHAPPDITGLALANGGMFPAERVRRIIDGREVESHGTREMPVWGDAFKSLPDGRSEQAVRGRIAAVVAYLASIQRRRA